MQSSLFFAIPIALAASTAMQAAHAENADKGVAMITTISTPRTSVTSA